MAWNLTYKGVKFRGTRSQMIEWLRSMGFGVAKASGGIGVYFLASAIGQILEVFI